MSESHTPRGDLEARLALYETVLEALTECVTVFDPAGVVTYANPAAERLVGRPVAGLSVGELRALFQVRDAEGTPVAPEAPIAQTPPGERARVLLRKVTTRGEARVLAAVVTPLRRGESDLGTVSSVRDVTDEHHLREALAASNDALRARQSESAAQQAELRAQAAELAAQQAELARSNEALAAASQHKSSFLASMSHELRTPLNAIIGFSEVLLADERATLDARHRRFIDEILAAGRHLLLLINDVLDLSKIEAGRMDLRTTAVNLAAEAVQATSLVASTARQKGLRIDNRLGSHTPSVAADADRLRQVLVNLVSNAVKFTPAGGLVTLDARSEGDTVRLEVSDTGIGIDPLQAARLFEPFSQLDTGTARRYGGTGLGLSISRRLVELMGGSIGFVSEPGKGATFYFVLPRAPTESAGRNRAPSPSLLSHAMPPTVVLVEDADADARIITESLERARYVVRVARSGEEALTILGQGHPDLLIIDLGLPGLSGVELLERVRSSPGLGALRTIVLTARDLSATEREHLEAAADAVVQKGFVSRAEFLDLVKSLCPPADEPAPRRRLRVLVIDDNAMNRRVLRAMLEPAGCAVVEVADANEGLRLAREGAADLVLMDLQMPGLDGLEATRILRSDPATRDLPILAVTAHAMVADAARSLEAGCNGHVAKPVARAELYAAIDRALGETTWRSVHRTT